MEKDGGEPIRFQAIIMISLLILMSTPIGQAEENQGTILDIEMGYWVNENWNPLTTSFEFEIRLIDPWTGQVIYYEITNDTKIYIAKDNAIGFALLSIFRISAHCDLKTKKPSLSIIKAAFGTIP